jgi:hypothetical protein
MFCAGTVLHCFATVYFVSTSGNDANPGTLSEPWLTIQHAANTVSAGDSVLIHGGVYRERVAVQRSGASGKPIVFRSYQGQIATIDGTGIEVPPYSGLLDISGQSFIVLSGLRVINSNEAGILADGSGDIVIERCATYNTATSGIGVWNSHDVVVADNHVELACTNGMQECITVGGTMRFEVRGNTVIHCRKEGICPKDGSSFGRVHANVIDSTDHVGIYVDAWNKHTHDIDVYGNIVRNTARKDGLMVASEQGGLLENVRLFNNISHTNAFSGIGISACCPDVPDHPIRNVVIVNNTVVGNGTSGWGGGIGIDRNPLVYGIIIRNNICSGNLSFQIAIDSAVPGGAATVDHNLIDGFRSMEGEVRGLSFVEGDPQFVNAAAFDFHLGKASPAIDAGAFLLAPLIDFDGNPRPSGARPDIGCHEYLQPTSFYDDPVAALNTMTLSQNSPNPFSYSTTIRYILPRAEHVRMDVCDLLGRVLLSPVNEPQPAGAHQCVIDVAAMGGTLPRSGLFFCRLTTSSGSVIRTMNMLR